MVDCHNDYIGESIVMALGVYFEPQPRDGTHVFAISQVALI